MRRGFALLFEKRGVFRGKRQAIRPFLLQVEPMSARILSFRTSCDLHFTLGERRAAAVWCAFRGPAWSIHVTQTATGYMVLGVVTPGRTAAGDEPVPAWIVRKMPAGLLLIDAVSGSLVGTYPSISDVLAAVTKVEGAEAANDNQSDQMPKLAHAATPNRPVANGTRPRRRARSRSIQPGRRA